VHAVPALEFHVDLWGAVEVARVGVDLLDELFEVRVGKRAAGCLDLDA
jgi:hypothetical protein